MELVLHESMRFATVLLCCAACTATSLTAEETPRSASPFLPPGQKAAPAAEGPAPFEFTGLFTTGARTMVSVTSTAERRSRWIAVGAQADGIRVVSHDPQSQRIMVEHGGRTYPLTLKRAAPRDPSTAPAMASTLPAGPLPVAQATEPVPVTEAEKEREARFLVSDLLEIGMIQRKAYEEAQKKAEEEDTQDQNGTRPRAQRQER
jgi:hypothetical protein